MTFWESVWKLVRFELKQSYKYFSVNVLFLIVLVLLLRNSISEYMEEASMGIDFVFVLSFVLFSQWGRPKQFQLQKMSGIHYVTPVLITLNQLAIDKRIIVVYRFMVYVISYGTFAILLLCSVFPYFHPYLTLSEYIVFSVIWLAIGIYIGGTNPAFEAYSNLGWNIFFALIFGSVTFFLYLFVFFKWYESGFVGWTMDIAIHYPWISVMTSFILAAIGLIFWMNVMKKRMEKTDYLA